LECDDRAAIQNDLLSVQSRKRREEGKEEFFKIE